MIFQQYVYRSYEGSQHRWKPVTESANVSSCLPTSDLTRES
jgi:hypothetical protein